MKKLCFPCFVTVILACLFCVNPAGAKKPEVTAASGMVAAAHPLASQAGVDVLKDGGNAVDAAVAAAFAIGVVEPFSNGIGGEGEMIIYTAQGKKAVAIDYRSVSPASADFSKGIPKKGHMSVAVPGTVAGLCLALEKYGTLTLSRVLEPAIKLAGDGFVVTSTLAGIILDNYESIIEEEGLAKIFCPDTFPLAAGDTLKNPDLAQSLRKIAEVGAEIFYKGEIAEKIAAEMRSQGAFINKSDLAAYRAFEREPVRSTYRGYQIVSSPPPVGGLAVLESLNILENFDLSSLDPLAPERMHLLSECMKRGMADWRAFVGDPDFVDVPVSELLSKSYAKIRAAEIDTKRISENILAGNPVEDLSPSTTSLSTVDKDGNMVALTQTISDFFGSKVIIDGTGIILNNEMKNFSEEGVNSLAPGKRMRTSISPTIVIKDGRAFVTIGTPGGIRILTTMVLLLSNLIDHGMEIQQAIDMPRFFPQDKVLSIEPRFPEKTLTELVSMGYTLEPLGKYDLYFGGAQGIAIDPKTGLRIGGADPRRDGVVVGYVP